MREMKKKSQDFVILFLNWMNIKIRKENQTTSIDTEIQMYGIN